MVPTGDGLGGTLPAEPSARKRSKSVDELLDEVGILLTGVRRFSQARTRRVLVRQARLLLNQIDDKLLDSAPALVARDVPELEPAHDLHDPVLSS